MRGKGNSSHGWPVVAAVVSVAAFAGSARAGNYDMGSLASQFLQSKTEITILSHDDLAAPDCHRKRFLRVSPVVQPSIRRVGGIAERRWQEEWTLERCGIEVSYQVFFTDVGDGGAYYAIIDPQTNTTVSDEQKAELQKTDLKKASTQK